MVDVGFTQAPGIIDITFKSIDLRKWLALCLRLRDYSQLSWCSDLGRKWKVCRCHSTSTRPSELFVLGNDSIDMNVSNLPTVSGAASYRGSTGSTKGDSRSFSKASFVRVAVQNFGIVDLLRKEVYNPDLCLNVTEFEIRLANSSLCSREISGTGQMIYLSSLAARTRPKWKTKTVIRMREANFDSMV